jgi:hypothetical protein
MSDSTGFALPFVRAVLVIVASAGLLASLSALAPLPGALVLAAVLIWFAVPGILLGRRLYGSWAAAVLAGPAWGYVFSSLALLAFWAAGIRSFGILMLAPLPAAAVIWPARALARDLRAPTFTRRDIAAVALIVLSVLAIVVRPYARIGAELPEGRAYRAYFTADFVWAMAVVAEISKGDMPPRNPYYLNDELRYYWLPHLLPGAEYRAGAGRISVEQILRVSDLVVGLFFAGFFYFFVRHFVDRPIAAAFAIVFVLFCSSFQGAERIWYHWRHGIPFGALRGLNINAITNWFYGGMKVDGLHRLLLYQPQHQIAYLLGVSAVLLVHEAHQARVQSRPLLLLLAGTFVGLSMLFSSFAALMLAVMLAIYVGWSVLYERRWKTILPAAVAAGVPLGAAVVLANVLHYVDTTGGELVTFGVNPLATHRAVWVIFIGFGPVVLVALAGIALAIHRRALRQLSALWMMLTACALFYFFVDLPDSQNSVGWHAGKLAFIAMTPLCGFAFQELWRRAGPVRVMSMAVVTVIALLALPTVLIDIYNTQDVWNRGIGPGFRWTVLLTPEEVESVEWLKRSTPLRARVQVEPWVRGRDTWAYVPAFAERRMAAGIPISMIPLAKYEKASEHIRTIYESRSASAAYDLAAGVCVDYLVIGPPERAAYPQLQPLLDASPHLFVPVFRNSATVVYAVSRIDRTGCPL